MELKDLRCFNAVAEAGGFRSAARRLGMEQSVVSRRVAALEDEIGVSLLERSRSGVRLTTAGRRFLDEVRSTLSQLDVAVTGAQAAGKAAAGRIRIGITSSIASGFVRDLLASWRAEHPDVTIDLVEGAFHEHAAALRAHELDLSFQLSTVAHDGLDAEQLWTDGVFVAVPSDSSEARHARCTMAGLADAHFVVSTRNSGPDIRDFLTTRLYRLGRSPSIQMIDVGREALLHCVGLGMGVTITTSADRAIRYPGVAFVEVVDERLPFSAIWSAYNDNPALRRFLSVARVGTTARRKGLPTDSDPEQSAADQPFPLNPRLPIPNRPIRSERRRACPRTNDAKNERRLVDIGPDSTEVLRGGTDLADALAMLCLGPKAGQRTKSALGQLRLRRAATLKGTNQPAPRWNGPAEAVGIPVHRMQ